MQVSVRLAESADYPEITTILNSTNDDGHQVAAGALERLDERWVQHDATFRRVVGYTGGVPAATGFVCATWGDVTEPLRFWVSIAVHPATAPDGADSEVLDFLLDTVDAPVREVWTCIREDHARHVTFLDRRGFVERFRSWGAHLDLRSFDARRWTESFDRVSAEGIRLVPYPELHADVDRDQKLSVLQDALEHDVEHFDPIVPRRESDIVGPETIHEALIVAIAPDGSYVGLACLLGSPTDASIACGLTGVLRAYRNRGIATALKVRTAEIAQGWGAAELNTGGGGGADAAIVRLNRAVGFDVEPPWITYAKVL